MTIEVFPYIPSYGIRHNLNREFLANSFNDGYIIENTHEISYTHPNGCAEVVSYPGCSEFSIGFNRTLAGANQLADNIWKFCIERLDNLNEPFYYYNCPTERTTPDLTGVDTIGRYYVKLKNPNDALNRELFKLCLYSYKLVFIETRDFS